MTAAPSWPRPGWGLRLHTSLGVRVRSGAGCLRPRLHRQLHLLHAGDEPGCGAVRVGVREGLCVYRGVGVSGAEPWGVLARVCTCVALCMYVYG